MADKHEEAARKKALAAKYADIARKREETLKERLSNAQYDFFRNQGHSVDQTIYSDLVTAMRNPSIVPSEYVSKKLGWLFDLAIPSREKDVILYFADTEQYRRTRVMLERAMEDSTTFTFGEFSALSAHPVVYPMLKNLVLISADTVGFLAENGLVNDNGTIQTLGDSAEIKIAHPFDLYSKGCWRDYQKYLFENKIAQPFRQVFRELYVKTAEEMDMFHSLRYAGNQIQPAKTVGALKSRRWVADIEDGLQKVYYKENIVAQIYALADWFSPADIEAPTLEWVCFTNRKTGEEIKIADIPDIIFSEVMRDVDLAVSVAHAGGVDPETSHSTMEMRAAILSFVLPMLRIENVKVEGHHAIVNGKLAEYSIHLGSGVVHQLGGAMIPVLPVHSQHRGCFLPLRSFPHPLRKLLNSHGRRKRNKFR